MATAVQASEFSTKHKLLDPDGPVCLIIQAQMGVAAGLDRFQPAGFPEIGHVIYDSPDPDRKKVCIVDSPASMANHLEQVCLAGENDPNLHLALMGVPYVKCVTDRAPDQKQDDPRDRVVTTTLLEGHRIGSEYFIHMKDKPTVLGGEHSGQVFRQVLRHEFGIVEVKPDSTYFIPPEAWWNIYKTLFMYDPNSLIHGVLFAKEQIKISRVLTGHLEAFGAGRVGRSGVKFNIPKAPKMEQPIFAVDEETAREIRATFIIDLALLRSYGREVAQGNEPLGLNPRQKEFLLAFALWKIQKLLGATFSYRSGCKLRMEQISITTDAKRDGEQPLLAELPEINIQSAITAAKFPAEPITRVYYPFGDLFKPNKDDATTETAEEAEPEEESEE